MSQDNTLKAPTAQAIRIQRQLEGQLNTETGRAKIIETFAEIQEAEAKGHVWYGNVRQYGPKNKGISGKIK